MATEKKNWSEHWGKTVEEVVDDLAYDLGTQNVTVHERDIHVQLCGWEIILRPDGTYMFKETFGG